MLTRSRIRRDLCPRVARRALAVAALLAVSLPPLRSRRGPAQQKKNGNVPTTGSIEIRTRRALPIYIDGVYSGETTDTCAFPNQRPASTKS